MSESDFKFRDAKQKKMLLDFVQNPLWIDRYEMDGIVDYVNVKYNK